MRRLYSFPKVVAAMALAAVVAAPSVSDAQQALSFNVGGFVPRGETSRSADDVLRNNLNAGGDSLLFEVNDFNNVTVGADWLIGLNDFMDAGLGVGYYSKTVPSIYADLVNANGREIEQDLSLRIVPLTATIRFLPIGRRDAFTPYIGGGVGVMRFRYQESGEFVDVRNNVFKDTFTATGTAVGPVILGGARFPIGGVDVGGEVRYQHAIGDISGEDDFLGTEIDLGGFSYLLTFTVKF